MAREQRYSEQSADTLLWKKKAEKMVEEQLIKRGISDQRLLEAMENTPRHLFVPPSIREYAYHDGPLSIGEEQTISQPYVVAIMTESLKLKGDERVLEIGTGSGYQAAILSQLVDTCYTIELIESLANNASGLLKELGYNNVVVRAGDGYQGWPEHAPYDCVIITAAPEEIPPKLIEQLKIGGKM
ncbi:MAG: protein-L-isoaspartate(D-aspartate) O-methyltransferase, partial [Verrucomicrobia bacterium]|nr:protein-L-isoaspartate(D-aspartate) O-methyltransferase [Prolixibacteraceae bacterium]